MLKKLSLLVTMATSLSFANTEVAYSQNNPPSQNKVGGYVWDNYPILFNANLLIGEVMGNQIPLYLKDEVKNFVEKVEEKVFPKGIDAGFRIGLGLGLHQIGNLSVQWTWFHTNKSHTTSYIWPGGIFSDIFTPQLINFLTFVAQSVETKAKQKFYYQTVDLLFQTASWQLASKIRFQPFGGIRYLSFKQVLDAHLFNETNTLNTHSQFKTQGTGVLIGTDIKYLFSKHFFFFGNGMIGLIGGYQKVIREEFANFPSFQVNNQVIQTKERLLLSFNPFYQIQFGLGFDKVINDQWLLSIYIAYELSSMIQTSAKSLNFIDSNNPTNLPRTNDMIKTQFGIFGILIAF